MLRRERTPVLLLALGALLALLNLSWFATPYAGPSAWDGDPRFSVDRAWDDVTTLATRFPRRWSGSADRAAAADWLAERLGDAGLQVRRDTFTAALGEPEPVTLENVWAISPGTDGADEVVVAVGNYDMAPTSFQAASDTAGHVGVLLELARVIHAAPHRRTVVFLFPDGEEWGMLGARRFVQTFPDRDRIVAALSIEDLDVGGFAALRVDGIGQFRGFAPMWLRALAADAARREGYPTDEVPPLVEWLQRSVLVSFTDQGPFLGAGVPAVQLGGRGDDPALQRAVYHLPGDTIDHMRPESVGAYGRIQERILRAIDAMPAPPRESDFYLRLRPDRVVPGGRLLLAQVAVFLPLLATVVLRAVGSRMTAAAVARAALEAGAVLLVLLAGLAAVKTLPVAGLVPVYELYPATSRHPFLTDVHWPAVAAVFFTIALAAWLVRRAWRALAGAGVPGEPARISEVLRLLAVTRAPGIGRGSDEDRSIAALLALLLAIAAVALIDNPFGAVTFLVLPAVLWIHIEPGGSVLRRLWTGLLVAAGFLALAALMWQYAQVLEIGWAILWYLMMGVAYGQFSLLRIVLALATAAIGLRLLAVGLRSRG